MDPDQEKNKKSVINPRGGNYQRKELMLDEYVSGILAGDRIILSRAITLLESTLESHRQLARELVEKCLPHSGNSFRLGITGSPGVGKSTFIESFGLDQIQKGRKVAVLAIDPSSGVTRGSILGDKTRMEKLSRAAAAYIRPSAAGDSLGGVARKTRETILLCEAAGFDMIIIETVGVGQSETAVHSMVDFFLLLLLPGAGDELQGIKRGVMEMADLIAVNKADNDRMLAAQQAKQAYQNAVHLFPAKENGWPVKVMLCSALENTGVIQIAEQLERFKLEMKAKNLFESNRRSQARYWMFEYINAKLKDRFFNHPKVKKQIKIIEDQVLKGEVSSFKAGDTLFDLFNEKNNF
ncbi:MAG: methylmalonyl Co-A mutase-associated GTPase MeaB [Saprospiraceae bacterium]|nr:methylmalonyl Co-A mutase-associated GTPase MeaB [Saprospiraceae bacterium]MCB9326154.1 methylmalonyl Co-A mutase-associated GTPase MeaB [Lewinellaceae bacterium]